MSSPGLLLAVAIVSEVMATTALRVSDGFTRPLPVAVMLVGYVCSFYLLSLIVREMSLGLTYAIWAGVGTALVAAIGVVGFGETLKPAGVAGIALIVGGVGLVNLTGMAR